MPAAERFLTVLDPLMTKLSESTMNLKYRCMCVPGSDEETSPSILGLEAKPRVMVVEMEEGRLARNVF